MITLYWFKRTQGAAKSSANDRRTVRRPEAGFSLVEVCIAIGIFAFAILSIVGLLVIALDTSRETQRDSTLTSIIRTMDVDLRSTNVTSATNYYDGFGKPVSATNASYRVLLTSIIYTPPNGSGVRLWTANIAYPPPAYPQSTAVLFGNTTY